MKTRQGGTGTVDADIFIHFYPLSLGLGQLRHAGEKSKKKGGCLEGKCAQKKGPHGIFFGPRGWVPGKRK
jgi:hypothetical protein